MSDSEHSYPQRPVRLDSTSRTAPSLLPAVWFAGIAGISLLTGGVLAAVLCAVGAVVFALAARRELQADDALAGTRRSLAAMIVGVSILVVQALAVVVPFAISWLFLLLG